MPAVIIQKTFKVIENVNFAFFLFRKDGLNIAPMRERFLPAYLTVGFTTCMIVISMIHMATVNATVQQMANACCKVFLIANIRHKMPMTEGTGLPLFKCTF